MRYVFILMVILCTSCGTALPTVKPYKLDVQQGNVVTSKMLLQLRPGMTKSQVRFIMGTPLIQDSFHGNRWDYAYQLREGGKITEQRRVILDFENDLLKTVRGDVVPSGSDAAKSEAESANIGTRVVAPAAKPEEKSLLSKLKFWGDDAVKAPKVATTASVSATNAKLDDVKPNAAELKADEVVQKSTESVMAAPAPIVDEPKSMLAVPLAVVAEPTAPVSAESVAITPATVAESKVETVAVLAQPIAPLPENIPFYESSLGMVFERSLKFVLESVEPVVTPAEPGVSNKSVPKPKDLPAEGAPGFFDRMLEKIGF